MFVGFSGIESRSHQNSYERIHTFFLERYHQKIRIQNPHYHLHCQNYQDLVKKIFSISSSDSESEINLRRFDAIYKLLLELLLQDLFIEIQRLLNPRQNVRVS